MLIEMDILGHKIILNYLNASMKTNYFIIFHICIYIPNKYVQYRCSATSNYYFVSSYVYEKPAVFPSFPLTQRTDTL